MKILNWMQRKFQDKTASAKKNPVKHISSTVKSIHQDYIREEHSDWWPASGLLAIGTFGLNKNVQKQEIDYKRQNSPYSQDDAKISENIINTLQQDEMFKISETIFSMMEDSDDDQVAGSIDSKPYPGAEDYYLDLRLVERSLSFALSRGIKSNDASTKKSFSILFKKMYLQTFSLNPGLKDPSPESRIDKILKAIFHKKIYPQSTSASMKKYLKNKLQRAAEVKSDSKWIKTDSEYIVLEM